MGSMVKKFVMAVAAAAVPAMVVSAVPAHANGLTLTRQDVDGVLCSHAFASPFHRFSVALSEYMGIAPTFSNTLQVSGETAATMFNVGAAAIAGGLAEVVLVVGGDSLLSGLTPDLALRSSTRAPAMAVMERALIRLAMRERG